MDFGISLKPYTVNVPYLTDFIFELCGDLFCDGGGGGAILIILTENGHEIR